MQTAIHLFIAVLAAIPLSRAADIIGFLPLKGMLPVQKQITPTLDNDDCCAMHNGKTPALHFSVIRNA
jgi:hypothetical protein